MINKISVVYKADLLKEIAGFVGYHPIRDVDCNEIVNVIEGDTLLLP